MDPVPLVSGERTQATEMFGNRALIGMACLRVGARVLNRCRSTVIGFTMELLRAARSSEQADRIVSDLVLAEIGVALTAENPFLAILSRTIRSPGMIRRKRRERC